MLRTYGTETLARTRFEIYFCTQEAVLATPQAKKNPRERFGNNELEWTGSYVGIRQEEFLSVGEACMATF